MNKDNGGRYEKIINLPHHVSEKRPQMSRRSRAAQFAPFAALSGYDSCISEASRLTEERAEVDEERERKIKACLDMLAGKPYEGIEISVRYFVRDDKKSGGAYHTAEGVFRRIDEYARTVIFEDGRVIPIDDICDIEAVRAECD